MAAEFCPKCGAARTGAFKFCRGCGFDFEGNAGEGNRPVPPEPQPATARPSFSEMYRQAPVPASPSAAPTRRSGRGFGLAVLATVVIAVAVGLAVFGGGKAPGASAGPTPSVSPQASVDSSSLLPSGTPNPAAPPEEFRIGQAISIVDGDQADLGTITVLASKQYSSLDQYLTPSAGNVWVGAQITYKAVAAWSYNPFNFVAHDDAGRQYEYAAYNLEPALDSGTLAAGRQVTGWISFEVPKTTAHLWLDYQTYGGKVIFSVPLY